MMGFPKRIEDFKTELYTNPLCKSYLQDQREHYLDPASLLLEKKQDWKHFPFHKLFNKAFDFCPPENPPSPPYQGGNFIESSSLLPNSFLIPRHSSTCGNPDKPPTSSNQTESSSLLPGSFVIPVVNGQVATNIKQEHLSVFLWKDFLQGRINLPAFMQKPILLALSQKRNPLCSLNNTFYPQGFILLIKKGFQQSIAISYYQEGLQPEQALNLRNFIFVEEGAEAQVIETFYSRPSKKPLFLNVQSDCFVAKNSQLEHICLDQSSPKDSIIHQLFAKLEPQAQAVFFTLCLQAGLSRWLKDISQAQQSSLQLKALSLMSDFSHTEHKTCVRNQGRESVGEQLYKSFLFDSAKHVFQGFVSIEEQAEESDSSQLNKNYLFGPKAVAVAFPELDVCPAKVKASHGAVLSPFSENEQFLFYLKSRGIAPSKAFHLILLSLLQETLSGLKLNTQNLLKTLIKKRVSVLEEGFKNA